MTILRIAFRLKTTSNNGNANFNSSILFKRFKSPINDCNFNENHNHKNFSTDRSLFNNKEFSKENLGFIGFGKIAQSIIVGLVKKKKILPEQIYASDANWDYLKHLKQNPFFIEHKINFLNDNKDVFEKAKNIMLCVKPNDLIPVLKEVNSNISHTHLILSIAAGVQLNQIEKNLVKDARVIRIMTNTAALIQKSCSVFSKGKNATNDDAEYVKTLLETIGTCEGEINEELMDVTTALSGSGPAYMFVILDALADGGVKMGLTRKLALKLAAQTMLGSASMVMEELKNEFSNKHLMQMKEEVCSPGGTTIYGVSELENGKLRSALINCIEAATHRAKELQKCDK